MNKLRFWLFIFFITQTSLFFAKPVVKYTGQIASQLPAAKSSTYAPPVKKIVTAKSTTHTVTNSSNNPAETISLTFYNQSKQPLTAVLANSGSATPGQLVPNASMNIPAGASYISGLVNGVMVLAMRSISSVFSYQITDPNSYNNLQAAWNLIKAKPCTSNSSCESNWCYNGLCKNKSRVGQPCQASDECVTGLCGNGVCQNMNSTRTVTKQNGDTTFTYDKDHSYALGSSSSITTASGNTKQFNATMYHTDLIGKDGNMHIDYDPGQGLHTRSKKLVTDQSGSTVAVRKTTTIGTGGTGYTSTITTSTGDTIDRNITKGQGVTTTVTTNSGVTHTASTSKTNGHVTTTTKDGASLTQQQTAQLYASKKGTLEVAGDKNIAEQTGKYKPGQMCRQDHECFSDWCYNGMCVAKYKPYQASPAKDQCQSRNWNGAYCLPALSYQPGHSVQSTLTTLQENAACTQNDQCDSNWCDNGTCKKKLAGGKSCTSNDQCMGNLCLDGLCYPFEIGTACSSNSQCASNYCNAGYCVESEKVGGQVCQADDECKSKYCDTGHCWPYPKDAYCTSNSQCGSNLCSYNKCQAQHANGLPCTENTDCASNYCNSSTHTCQ